MSIVKHLIESLVEEQLSLLDEKAKTLNDVRKGNLALWVKDKGYEKTFCLYNPSKAAEMINDFNKQTAIDAMVGTIAVARSNRCGAWVVIHVAAHKGFGPLLYEIAMSDISPSGLTSDRKSVSPEAQEVWNYNLVNRAGEFNITDVPANCRNPQVDSRNPALNKIFAIKKRLNFTSLIQNHESFKLSLGALGSKLELLLPHAEQWFFDDVYVVPTDDEE